MPSPRRSRYEWQDIITTYRASGMTAAQFAKEHHLNIHTFRYWTHAINIAKDMRKNTMKFVELKWTKQTPPPITVVLPSSVQLHIQHHASCEQVTSLINALL